MGGGQYLYAVNAATGGLVWRADQRVMSYSRSAIAGGIICFNTGSGVAAVDTGTGDLLWEYLTDISATSPTVVDGVVYLGAWNKRLHAVDAATGKRLWQYETGDQPGHLIGVVQGVLERDAGSQREPGQHQVFTPVLGPQPTPQPLGVAGHVGARLSLQMPRQVGRKNAGEMF